MKNRGTAYLLTFRKPWPNGSKTYIILRTIPYHDRNMARSTDSFFIRAKVTSSGGAFNQTEVDLGAYVDALGKSVLRIHSIATQLYPALPGEDWVIPSNSHANVSWQLTTQTQAGLVSAQDRSVVSTGRLDIANDDTISGFTFLSNDSDILPQDWTNGYLIAVESLYLGATADAQITTSDVVIVMECTVETLSQQAAMALALSQQ